MLSIVLTSLHAQTMYVKQFSGTITSYDVNNISKINFNLGNINVTKIDKSIDSYAIIGLQHINFGDLTSAIRNVNADNKSLNTYPNPAREMLFVNLEGIVNSGASINIISLEGKLIKSQLVNGVGTVSIDLSQLPQGFYFCRYNNGNETSISKVVKQ